jgi:hypothetical protein
LRAMTGNSATKEAMEAIAEQRLDHAGAVDISTHDKGSRPSQ